jgi:hypothetical protein
MSLDAQTRKLQEDLATINNTRSAIEATKGEFQPRMKVAEARGEQGRGQLVALGEVDVVYYSPERLGRGRATRHSDNYEETLQDLEDRFDDHHIVAAFRNQLKTSTERAGESLQEFATAMEQLAHRAYPTNTYGKR